MKRRLPSLNALRSFEAAARLGRMTEAADELAVTPGAISRQVRELELSLGIQLFEGSKNKPRLTAAGSSLLPALSAALDQMEAAVNVVRNDTSGILNISCFSTFTVKWLIPRLFDFSARHPEIDVRLSTSDRLLDTDRERHDLIITVEDTKKSGTTNGLLLFPERLGPVLSPALAAAMQLTRPNDLSGKSLLHTKGRPDAWQMWCQSAGIEAFVTDGTIYEHYYFTLEAAIAGLGICVAPWHLVVDDIRSGRLVAPLGFRESAYRYIAIRRRQRDSKLDKFCDWLKDQAEQTALPENYLS